MFLLSWLTKIGVSMLCFVVMSNFYLSQSLAAQLEGYGTHTPGGAGGEIYHVTNLNDSGPGSLRDAVSQPHRYIVFDVAGTIKLDDKVKLKSFQTIDGDSAPYPGITIENDGLIVRDAHDIIIRRIRSRNSRRDGINLSNGAYNIVIDGVSIYNSADGNLDITYGAHDVTVQWSILGKTVKNKNMLIKTQIDVPQETSYVTLHHNLFVGNGGRNPLISNNNEGTLTIEEITADFRNNVVADWDFIGTGVECGAKANIEDNVYISPSGSSKSLQKAIVVYPDEGFKGGNCGGFAYVEGNVSNNPSYDINNGSRIAQKEPFPFPAAAVQTQEPCEAAERVLMDAGVRPVDNIDAQLIANVSLAGCRDLSTIPGESPGTSSEDKKKKKEDKKKKKEDKRRDKKNR